MHQYPPSYYVRQLKPRLAALLTAPASSRLLWLPVHASVIALGILVIAGGWVPALAFPAVSLGIGLAFGGLMFLGHETMHGAVLRGRFARGKTLVGALCFAPLLLSPRLWSVWHNRVHHANGNRLGVDPDMYPSLAAYRQSGVLRFVTDNFAIGGRRWRGLLTLGFGFSGQSLQMLIAARSRLQISARDHRRALAEAALFAAGWAAVAIAIGPAAFVFAYLIPLLVANIVVMLFIVTNHGLSPATDTNDPLLGSLSVTVPRWLEWLTLDFGYHVEHHLFPAASTRNGRAIRAALVEVWPERYQSMPLRTAIAKLFRTGRVYQDATTLVDPRGGGEWRALGPVGHAEPPHEAAVTETQCA